MHFNDGAVERDGFNPDPDEFFALQPLKNTVEHAGLAPAVHPRVDRMPVAKARRQSPPFAPLLSDVENRVEHLEIPDTNIAALPRQDIGNPFKLFGSQFHFAC